MNISHFRGVDLNLLVVFTTLIETRNTTKAAERLFLTQSAVSHALARLRRLLKDQLFVRSSRGLVPTPRAEELWRDLIPTFAELERIVTREVRFDPRRAEREFKLGLPSSLDVCVTPALLSMLASAAPRISLVVRPTSFAVVADQLDADEVDVAMTHIGDLRPWHVKERIGSYGYACLFDGKRMKLRPPLTLKQYLSLPHILTSARGDRRGVVDEALDKRKLERRVLVASADFASVATYLKSADAIATLPEYSARKFARLLGLTMSRVPFDLPPFEISMAWHSKYSGDAAMSWVRKSLREACLEHC
jgi:LysR family transcriptional activator of mexEF-oprN operon